MLNLTKIQVTHAHNYNRGCSLTSSYVIAYNTQLSSVHFSRSVISDSLRPHGLQHTRPPCPSPTPGVYSNSCPLTCVLLLSRNFKSRHVFQPLFLSLSHKSDVFQIGPPPSCWIRESSGRRPQPTYN